MKDKLLNTLCEWASFWVAWAYFMLPIVVIYVVIYFGPKLLAVRIG